VAGHAGATRPGLMDRDDRSQTQADSGSRQYGTGLLDIFPRIPVYVDKILKGTKPGDLPIEVLTQHILVINLKTAREIGVTMPSELLKQADQVIE
jgi:putative ABC transport system substrate-binding protein